MDPCSVFCFFGFGAILGVACFTYPILQPALRAVKGHRRIHRFFLSDILWLLLVAQWPLCYVACMSQNHFHEDSAGRTIVALLLLAAATYVWWRAATMLTSMGVEGIARRGLFLALIVPVAIFGALPVVVFTLAALICLDEGPLWPLTVLLVLPPTVVGLHMLCRWVVAEVDPMPWIPLQNRTMIISKYGVIEGDIDDQTEKTEP